MPKKEENMWRAIVKMGNATKRELSNGKQTNNKQWNEVHDDEEN